MADLVSASLLWPYDSYLSCRLAGGPEGLRSLTNPKAIMTDRWPSIVQTQIPKVLDYPIRSLFQSWYVIPPVGLFSSYLNASECQGIYKRSRTFPVCRRLADKDPWSCETCQSCSQVKYLYPSRLDLFSLRIGREASWNIHIISYRFRSRTCTLVRKVGGTAWCTPLTLRASQPLHVIDCQSGTN